MVSKYMYTASMIANIVGRGEKSKEDQRVKRVVHQVAPRYLLSSYMKVSSKNVIYTHNINVYCTLSVHYFSVLKIKRKESQR